MSLEENAAANSLADSRAPETATTTATGASTSPLPAQPAAASTATATATAQALAPELATAADTATEQPLTGAHKPATAQKPFDRIDALWITAGFGLILLGILIGEQVLPLGAHTSGELALNHWLADSRFPALNTIALSIHYLLGPFIGVVVLVASFFTALMRGARRLAAVLAIVPAVGWGCAKIAKTIWNRPRPPAHELAALVHETSASFPSGHTAFAAALVATFITALAVYRKPIRWWMLLAGVLFVALVALSRMYVGAHYLADVLSAPLYCWGAVALIAPLLRRLRRPAKTA